MSQKEKEAAKKLAEAFDALPEAKKERLIGYAEGVADMVAKMPKEAERFFATDQSHAG